MILLKKEFVLPRKDRKLYKGAIYHVFDRGVAKQKIFEDDRDREKFLEILEELHEAYNFVIHAFCLMGNHYHLLIQTYEANLPEIMQRFLCKYAKYFNVKYKRPGYLFQDRYDDRNVYTESYFATLFRYLALNPVKDNDVLEPQFCVWSSYYDYYHNKNRYQFIQRSLIDNLFFKYKMNAKEIHNYIVCSDEEVEQNYNFDTVSFGIKESVSAPPLLLDNEARLRFIVEDVNSLDLSPWKRRPLLVFLLKKYTKIPDKQIARIVNYESHNSLSRIFKRVNASLLEDETLAALISTIGEKLRNDDTRDLHLSQK